MPYKNNLTTFSLLTIMVLTLMSSCKEKPSSEVNNEVPAYENPEFLAFYDQFSKDSVYQLAHTVWPLEGMPRMKDSLDTPDPNFMWKQEDWTLHKPYDDMDGTYSREFMDLGGVVVERISDMSDTYSMERRFGKLSSGWHLIFYREMGVY